MCIKNKEIEILIKKNHALKDRIAELEAEVERLKWSKSNSLKEFAERLKEIGQKRLWICGITEADIDNLLKEMVGDKK